MNTLHIMLGITAIVMLSGVAQAILTMLPAHNSHAKITLAKSRK